MRTTAAQVRVAGQLRRSVTALASRARAERRADLTLNQVAVLGRVLVEGPITPGEISAELGMAPQSLTRPLAALERRGLVARTPDPTDGRGALIGATDAGRRVMREEMEPRDRWLAQAVAAVCTDAERDVLARAAEIMQRVAAYGGGVAPAEP